MKHILLPFIFILLNLTGCATFKASDPGPHDIYYPQIAYIDLVDPLLDSGSPGSYDPFKLFVSLPVETSISSVGEAVSYVAAVTDYKLDSEISDPVILSSPIDPLAHSHQIKTVDSSILLISGPNAYLVIDHKNKKYALMRSSSLALLYQAKMLKQDKQINDIAMKQSKSAKPVVENSHLISIESDVSTTNRIHEASGRVWSISKGGLLSDHVNKWAAEDGEYTIHWSTAIDYETDYDKWFVGDILTALNQLFALYKDRQYPLFANKLDKTLIVCSTFDCEDVDHD